MSLPVNAAEIEALATFWAAGGSWLKPGMALVMPLTAVPIAAPANAFRGF